MSSGGSTHRRVRVAIFSREKSFLILSPLYDFSLDGWSSNGVQIRSRSSASNDRCSVRHRVYAAAASTDKSDALESSIEMIHKILMIMPHMIGYSYLN